MAGLERFGAGLDLDPPRFLPRRVIRVRHESHTRKAGRVGHAMPDRGIGYATDRDSGDHRYWKHDTYGISVEALEKAAAAGTSRVFIVETDTGDVYEYGFRQFAEAPLVPEADLADRGDPQRHLPRDAALRTWPDHAASFYITDAET